MRTAVIGFLAGAVSVLVFHQLGFLIATELGFLKVQIYNMKPLPPLGVPTIASLAFWGGLWGIAAAFIVPRLPGALGGRVVVGEQLSLRKRLDPAPAAPEHDLAVDEAVGLAAGRRQPRRLEQRTDAQRRARER